MNNHSSLLPEHWDRLRLTDVAACVPVVRLRWPQLEKLGIEVAIKREELLDPCLGGNKFYKLFYHLKAMQASGHQRALSFGGAYSNHLYALAAAGKALGIATVGVIRGEQGPQLSATLQDLQHMGMQLLFVARSDYRNKEQPAFIRWLQDQVGPFYLIPEGGGGSLGASGCREWAETAVELCPFEPTQLCVATATGTTLAGLLAARQRCPVVGVLVLKGTAKQNQALSERAKQLALSVSRGQPGAELSMVSDFHCGGYARYPGYLADFVAEFERDTGVELDPVYTAKLCWGIAGLVEQGRLSPGSRLLLLHTGGLQGKRGFVSA